MMSRFLFVLSVLLLASPLHADVTISDSTFADTDWSMTIYELHGNGGSTAAQQIFSDGNPAPAREVANTVNNGSGSFVGTFHRYDGAVYDPSTQGGIVSVDFLIDGRAVINPFGGGQWVTAAIEQDGIIYSTNAGFNANQSNWTTHALLDLTFDSFTELNTGDNPDFSAFGSAINFGFSTANSTIGGSYSNLINYDNFQFQISQVPEPTTGVLLAGLPGMLLIRRQRRQDQPGTWCEHPHTFFAAS